MGDAHWTCQVQIICKSDSSTIMIIKIHVNPLIRVKIIKVTLHFLTWQKHDANCYLPLWLILALPMIEWTVQFCYLSTCTKPGWQESNYVAIETGLRHLPIGHCQSTTGLTLCQSYITGSNFPSPPGCSCSSLKRKIFILEICKFSWT